MLYLIVGLSCLITGAGLVRYGINLGVKIVEKTREDLPVFSKSAEPTEQTHTGDFEVEENE